MVRLAAVAALAALLCLAPVSASATSSSLTTGSEIGTSFFDSQEETALDFGLRSHWLLVLG